MSGPVMEELRASETRSRAFRSAVLRGFLRLVLIGALIAAAVDVHRTVTVAERSPATWVLLTIIPQVDFSVMLAIALIAFVALALLRRLEDLAKRIGATS